MIRVAYSDVVLLIKTILNRDITPYIITGRPADVPNILTFIETSVK